MKTNNDNKEEKEISWTSPFENPFWDDSNSSVSELVSHLPNSDYSSDEEVGMLMNRPPQDCKLCETPEEDFPEPLIASEIDKTPLNMDKGKMEETPFNMSDAESSAEPQPESRKRKATLDENHKTKVQKTIKSISDYSSEEDLDILKGELPLHQKLCHTPEDDFPEPVIVSEIDKIPINMDKVEMEETPFHTSDAESSTEPESRKKKDTSDENHKTKIQKTIKSNSDHSSEEKLDVLKGRLPLHQKLCDTLKDEFPEPVIVSEIDKIPINMDKDKMEETPFQTSDAESSAEPESRKRKDTSDENHKIKVQKTFKSDEVFQELDNFLSVPRPIIKEDTPNDSNLRRSSRLRIPRLRHWEKLVYDQNGIPTVVRRRSHAPIIAIFEHSGKVSSKAPNILPRTKNTKNKANKGGKSRQKKTPTLKTPSKVASNLKKSVGNRTLYSPQSYLDSIRMSR